MKHVNSHGDVYYLKNNEPHCFHRLDGLAVQFANSEAGDYWIDGKYIGSSHKMTLEQFMCCKELLAFIAKNK